MAGECCDSDMVSVHTSQACVLEYGRELAVAGEGPTSSSLGGEMSPMEGISVIRTGPLVSPWGSWLL